MATHYYKRKNFGSFRINIGPNGVGYSVGRKGLRYTITSNGCTRITASIPKTGISHTSTNTSHKQESVDPIPVIVILVCVALFILVGY